MDIEAKKQPITRIRESYFSSVTDMNRYENLEDITIIWLDSQMNESLDCFDTQLRLRHIINYLLTFDNIDACVDYIQSYVQDEKLFFIVSGIDGELIIPKIHFLPKISSIYVFCADKARHEQWIKLYSKIRGIFIEKDSLFKKLTSDVTFCLNNLLPISVLGRSNIIQKSIRDLTSEGATFMWFQLLIEILTHMEYSKSEKRELLQICQVQYRHNDAENKKIVEFETTYSANQAVWWYTRDSFLFRLLNKALRTENFDIIYKFRSFIADLHRQLVEMHSVQTQTLSSNETFYRGQRLPFDELNKLKENINGYLSMNTFLSASTSSEVALMYSGDGEDRPTLESVIFEIEISTSVSPFANIKTVSYFKTENEVLFTIGSIFRIKDVLPQTDTIWLVQLVMDKRENQDIEQLTEHLKKEIGDK
ncbi:unnamed protein product, partial [Didymodactylos carnosus]